MPDHKGSTRSGKTTTDWDAAFAYYAALPPQDRSYASVAAKFGVSPRTVETHGRTGRWKERLRGIAEKAAAQTDDVLVQARVDQVQNIRKLIDASLIAFAERLRSGEMRMTPSDLERLNRLSLDLIDEITHPRTGSQASVASEQRERTPEHSAAVLDALAEIGALDALGLNRTTANDAASSDEHSGETQ